MKTKRLLALVPDPTSTSQPGGVKSASGMLFHPPIRGEFDVRIIDTTMRAHPVPSWTERLGHAALRTAQAVAEVGRWRPDVALAFCGDRASFYEKSLQLLVAKRFGARTLISPRSGLAESWLRDNSAARGWVASIGRSVDGFLVQSESWRRFYADVGVPADKLHVFYNSVDVDSWSAVAASRRVCPRERRFRFLFLGWATVDKGLPELVEAAGQLHRESRSFEVIIAGDGAVGERLRRQREQGNALPYLDMRGWIGRDEVARVLGQADALVLPSHAEGFPNVVAEAMACALPVIATDVGAIPEVIVPAQTGIVVPARDVNALTQAMRELMDSPVRAFEMGQLGLARVKERFGRKQASRLLLELLRGD